MHLRIPILGEKGKGSLFFHAIQESNSAYALQRLELEVHETSTLSPEKYQNKRLLIYDVQRHGPMEKNQS